MCLQPATVNAALGYGTLVLESASAGCANPTGPELLRSRAGSPASLDTVYIAVFLSRNPITAVTLCCCARSRPYLYPTLSRHR